MLDMDLTTLTDADLDDLDKAVIRERYRRQILATTADRADAMASAYLAARGDQPGDEWTQPTAAHDAYPEGWQATRDGKTWESLTPANVWEPGTSGWREVTTDGTPPEWVQPTGEHDSYAVGDEVSYQGKVWRSLIDGNVWSPADHPQG